jgi:uncharacterized protein (TIGR00645 family)
MERLIERAILASRWLLLPFCIGLCIGLLAFAVGFVRELMDMVAGAWTWPRNDLLIGALRLVDAVLVASLIVMVIISSYENFVSRLDTEAEKIKISWLGKLDVGSLKVKIASSIVAISSIHLLEQFLDAEHVGNGKLMWLSIMQMVFVATALLLAWLDGMSAHKN